MPRRDKASPAGEKIVFVPALDRFSPPARDWFASAFESPTPVQEEAWEAIASGEHVLAVAPTGSGKTLAAFLWAIDRLASREPSGAPPGVKVLYVSPLKALAIDIERNLRSPLAGIRAASGRLGLAPPAIGVEVRTGDTPPEDRRRMLRHPPEILITTPESLFLLLTSGARETLRGTATVIIDEVHSLAGNKRGSHLALSLERLEEILPRPPQRIGLSATVRPVEEVARFLGGARPVRIVNPPSAKAMELSVMVPVDDMTAPAEPREGEEAPGHGIWPAIEGELLALIRSHHTTVAFVNSRRMAERLCAKINDLAGEELARAHHGSVSRQERLLIEEELKAGRLAAVVATSSLELGIDIGAADLVVQIGAPPSVASGLQRTGRSGHQVTGVSKGMFFPRHRGDLLASAVITERMRAGSIEAVHLPANPLDVLAQQIVAMVAMEDLAVEELAATVRRAAPFLDLPGSLLDAVLDMLSGRYPSDEFAQLRPRLNWDRAEGSLRARPQARSLAVTNAGTIPDRGLFGVFLAGERAPRVGELDEEMVYESRPGEVFVLGASSWRIEDITHDRVVVSPAPGQPGKMPFWHGDAPGRPLELGQAQGGFVRELGALRPGEARSRLRAAGLDDRAASNLIQYLADQREATGSLPDDRTLVVERFRDELGDWRLCLHSHFGAQVHAPWAIAISSRIRQRLGVEVQTLHTDDGIVIRIPEADEAPAMDSILFDPDEIAGIVSGELGTSALFASRFRECASRALLLPRRRPGQRTPLWQQRQRSNNLLQVASGYGSFPIVLEAVRECLQDVFDLPGLEAILRQIRSREIRVVEVETERPSPFAASLVRSYVGAFLYEGEAPLAERKAQALSLDASLLAELLGQPELADLIDGETLGAVEMHLQRLAGPRMVRTIDDAHDCLRDLGDLSEEEASARGFLAGWLETLGAERRAIPVRVAGEPRWIAIEDAARYRDALGTALPTGVPDAFLARVKDPLGDLAGRYARTHAPFAAADAARRLGLGEAVVAGALLALEAAGRAVRGRFRSGSGEAGWCDTEVLRSIRRRSLAALRKEAEAAPPRTLAAFLPAWQGIGQAGSAPASLASAIQQLQGALIPASALERLVLPARLPGYQPAHLDALCASGEVLWAGAGSIPPRDGWVALYQAGAAPLLLPPASAEPLTDDALKVRDALDAGGAMFFRQIADRLGAADDASLLACIWELVWAGLVTNDTLAPLRAMLSRRAGGGHRQGHSTGRRPLLPSRSGPAAGAGRWSLLPEPSSHPTRRAHALVAQLLDRHGVLTRGAVAAERFPGSFAAAYRVLKAFEESGRCRRGYFVEGLGAAQFAVPGAVDRLRTLTPQGPPEAMLLAATDPASPYGAAIGWPDRPGEASRHLPGRKPGAAVVIAGGELAAYLERGGRSLLSFSDDPAVVGAAARALASSPALGRAAIERVDGEPAGTSRFGAALIEAGFYPSLRGLLLRA